MPSRDRKSGLFSVNTLGGWVARAAFCDKVLLQLSQKFFGFFLSFLGLIARVSQSQVQSCGYSNSILVHICLGRFDRRSYDTIPLAHVSNWINLSNPQFIPQIRFHRYVSSSRVCLIGGFSCLSGDRKIETTNQHGAGRTCPVMYVGLVSPICITICL